MNNIQFIVETAKDPDWESNNVKTISMDFIEGSEESLSQVRQGGINNSHLSDLQDSIILHGQQVPITVEDSGKDDNGNTVYKLVDGGHRWVSIRKLGKKNKHDVRWSVIRARIKAFKDEHERVQYQHSANDHTLPAKNNSNSDAALWLNKLVYKGIDGAPDHLKALLNSAGRNKTDAEAYEQDLGIALSDQFPDMGVRKRNNIVQGFMKKMPGKYKTWDSERAIESFKVQVREMKNVNLPEKYSIVSVREPNHVFHSAAGNSLTSTKEKGDKDREIVALVWTNKTTGKSDADINRDRDNTISKINDLNSHNRLSRNKKLINRVFIAPQKLDDNVETGFYEVPLNSHNKFSQKIPSNGW